MKFLSATLATVVGAASADPAIIATPVAATQYMTAAAAVPVAQPVYVAQPRLVATQPQLMEQQVMRTPHMATLPHLYNIQPVAYPQIIPAPQQYVNSETIKVVQPKASKEEVSQQYHSQDEFGNYSYGYANNNSEKQEIGNTRSGQVKGHYTYVDGNGMNRRVDYVADNNGFRAAGDGINKIKREAEPEAEAEPEPKKEMVQMTTSFMNNNGKQEGMRMQSYMTDDMPRQSVSRMSMARPSMMTYTNDMSVSPIVYMSMNAPEGATLTASRMTNQDMYMNNDMRRMDGMRMDGMRMDGMRMDDMRMDMNNMRRGNDLMMRRNDMRMNNNRDMYSMMARDGYRGQYLKNNLYRGRNMLRDSMVQTNPSNFMEIQQFEMKPNYNYRFDF